jgi:hypothetical protein
VLCEELHRAVDVLCEKRLQHRQPAAPTQFQATTAAVVNGRRRRGKDGWRRKG